MPHSRTASRRRSPLQVVVLVTLAGTPGVTCKRGERPASPTAGESTAAKGPWAFGLRPPGSAGFPPAVIRRLQKAWRERAKGYRPRTRHLRAQGRPKYTNRLFLSNSPYLRQHAHNPVNWYPWGEEAFAEARRSKRPILLSVGYSTCHWCHVMEEESFEDLEIARYLNTHYVAIKVDREQRPDVDAIYMRAVQIVAKSGGWPMTVWLTSARQPFYGGTYFPPRDGDRGAPVGFLTALRRLRKAYETQADDVADSAQKLTEIVRRSMALRGATSKLPGADLHHALRRDYGKRFDAQHGGLDAAPKFPSSLSVRFLLRYARRYRDAKAREMALLTLRQMAAGGMFDQIGGGFHRYSTDVRWLLPHFEKMLYDNALLLLAYLEGYQVTRQHAFAQTAHHVLRFVEREMRAAHGGFYSAIDADSQTPAGKREEGWFYTWTPGELAAVLGEDRARLVGAYFGVSEQGNFEGRTVLHRPRPLGQVAQTATLPPTQLKEIIARSRQLLYAARRKRPAPLRDDKVLTAWNGLMISAFAKAAFVLDEARYAKRAAQAARFILRELRVKGRLRRSYLMGRANLNAYLDDYAFLAAALLDLYQVTGQIDWLREARELDRVLREHYEDQKQGGFYLTSSDHEELLTRHKPSHDGPRPSGNSVQLLNLMRLYQLTDEPSYRERAARGLRAFASTMKRAPAALAEMLVALDFWLDEPKQIVIIAPSSRAEARPLLDVLRRTFVPNHVLVVAAQGDDLAQQAKQVPLLRHKRALHGRATAYVCQRGVCKWPTGEPKTFARQLAPATN